MRRAGVDEEVLGKDWGRVQPQGSQPTFLSHPRGGKLYILVTSVILSVAESSAKNCIL